MGEGEAAGGVLPVLGDDEVAVLLVDFWGLGEGGVVEEFRQRPALDVVDGVPLEPTCTESRLGLLGISILRERRKKRKGDYLRGWGWSRARARPWPFLFFFLLRLHVGLYRSLRHVHKPPSRALLSIFQTHTM